MDDANINKEPTGPSQQPPIAPAQPPAKPAASLKPVPLSLQPAPTTLQQPFVLPPAKQPAPPPVAPAPLKPPLRPLDVKKTVHPFLRMLPLVVLGFGLAAVAFTFLSNSVTKKPPVKKEPAKAIAKPPAKPATIVEVSTPVVSKTDEPLPVVQDRPIPTLTLSGILFGEQGSFALINGRAIAEGSNIEGAKLEKVYADKVKLSFEGKTITLRQH